jgi:deoxyribose-phosphate aldolase
MAETYLDLAKMIDHSMLQPNLTVGEFEAGIQLAIDFQCASVCIVPSYVSETAARLKGTGLFTCTVIGFPHGTPTSESKLYESEQALKHGAQELDAVINIGRVKSGDWTYVSDEICQLTELTHSHQKLIKVIFENSYLNEDEKKSLCHICAEAGADWVKTSTGYAPTGATPHDVQLMRESTPDEVQVKAAGGIRDLDSVLLYRNLGASRVGASRSSEILNAWRKQLGLDLIAAESSKASY